MVKVQKSKMQGMGATRKISTETFITQNLTHHTQIQNLQSQTDQYLRTQRIKQVAKNVYL